MSEVVKTVELERIFADLVVLWWDTKLCHWNIDGHQFPALHPLFESQYNALDDLADELAEHIRALGLKVPGRLSEYQKLADLIEADPNGSADEMVYALKRDYDQIRQDIETILSKNSSSQAVVTIDLLTRICTFAMHTSWMLGSSLPPQ